MERNGARDNSPSGDTLESGRMAGADVPYGWPATFTGTSLPVEFPVPSSPRPPLPQQYATPAGVTPQVDHNPALSVAKWSPPATGSGAVVAGR